MAVETRFPKWADNPPQFLLWEMDELIPMAFCWVFFLPTRKLWLGILIGWLLSKSYKKLKDTLPSFFYLHYLWFWGVWTPRTKSAEVLPGYISRYRE